MNKRLGMFGFAIFFSLMAVSVAALLFSLNSLSIARAATNAPSASANGDEGNTDSNPTKPPEVVIPAMFEPQIAPAASLATSDNVATVYFTPQDENTSTTVMFLYNTNATTATVGLQTFYLNGSQTISTSLSVPPLGLVRICADTVSTISASWSDVVLVNFTTFSTYGKMTLPAGVKADGYVAWNTTGTYDPLTSVQTLPLRFSTDPASLFLPTLQR